MQVWNRHYQVEWLPASDRYGVVRIKKGFNADIETSDVPCTRMKKEYPISKSWKS